MGYNDDIKMLIDAQDLTLPPPEREPQRQYYFIKKCREIVKKKSEELGRPLYACSVCMGWAFVLAEAFVIPMGMILWKKESRKALKPLTVRDGESREGV